MYCILSSHLYKVCPLSLSPCLFFLAEFQVFSFLSSSTKCVPRGPPPTLIVLLGNLRSCADLTNQELCLFLNVRWVFDSSYKKRLLLHLFLEPLGLWWNITHPLTMWLRQCCDYVNVVMLIIRVNIITVEYAFHTHRYGVITSFPLWPTCANDVLHACTGLKTLNRRSHTNLIFVACLNKA